MFVYVLNVFLHYILFIVIYLLCNRVYYTEDNKYILLLLLTHFLPCWYLAPSEDGASGTSLIFFSISMDHRISSNNAVM